MTTERALADMQSIDRPTIKKFNCNSIMMRRITSIILSLCIILPVSLSAETMQQTDETYFKDYPESTTEIVPKGKTIISSGSGGQRVQVIFKSLEMRSDKLKKNCIPQYSVDIVVNDNKIAVPKDVFCNLHNLNRGKIIFDQGKMVLILDGGDAASGYDVVIEFDQSRVKRKREYFTCCDPQALLSDEVY
jgi:hypothetical protein